MRVAWRRAARVLGVALCLGLLLLAGPSPLGLPLGGGGVPRFPPREAVRLGTPGVGRRSGGHFVVVDSLTPARVVLRDPAVGRLALPRGAFEEFWSGYVLVPRRQAPDGRVLSGLIEP